MATRMRRRTWTRRLGGLGVLRWRAAAATARAATWRAPRADRPACGISERSLSPNPQIR